MPSRIQDKYAAKARPQGSGSIARGRAAALEAAEKAAMGGKPAPKAAPSKTGKRK